MIINYEGQPCEITAIRYGYDSSACATAYDGWNEEVEQRFRDNVRRELTKVFGSIPISIYDNSGYDTLFLTGENGDRVGEVPVNVTSIEYLDQYCDKALEEAFNAT